MVDRFVTVSQDLGTWLVRDVRIPARKVTTIANGVDLSRFGNIGRMDARARLGLPLDRPVVGTVGRLDPVKDQAGLIESFSLLRSGHPDAILIVVGEGVCRQALETRVVDLGLRERVRLMGERRDIPDVLAAMDVFALPSIAEGMSNTMLEAMASGLPVVATRVGGNSELIDNGVTGTLVGPGDRSALAEAIGGYLDDPTRGVLHGKAARQRALSRFDLTRMVQGYTDLYCEVLKRRSRRSA